MDIFAKRLRERAEQLRISNSEAARRIGLEEGRYGHYIAGRREPDLATFKRIAEALGVTPDWLLGVEDRLQNDGKKAELLTRLENAAIAMSEAELELSVIQAEAIVSASSR